MIIGQKGIVVFSICKGEKKHVGGGIFTVAGDLIFQRERELLLSRFLANPTVGFLRSKKESRRYRFLGVSTNSLR